MKIIISFVFATYVCLAHSQHAVRNLDLIDPSLKLLYSLRGNNLVFSDVENDSYEVNSVNSDVIKVNDSTFQLSPKSFVSNDTVYLYSNAELIQSYLFVVHPHANPKVQLGNISSSYATIERIKNNPELVMISIDKYITKSKVLGYDLILRNQDGEVTQKFQNIDGNKLTAEMIGEIEKLSEGDSIEFVSIKVVDSLGIGRIFGPLEIQLEND